MLLNNEEYQKAMIAVQKVFFWYLLDDDRELSEVLTCDEARCGNILAADLCCVFSEVEGK